MAERKYLIKADGVVENARTDSPTRETPSRRSLAPLLSTLVGLSRTGVNWARVPADKESFIYHSHYREEEWIYIISGRGIAEIDGEEFEVAAGDFMVFPTPAVAHHLRKPCDEDLIYLVGGENHDVEIAGIPWLGKRMLRLGQKVEIYDVSDARDFGSLEEEIGTDQANLSNTP